jgi:tRNA pseudouridine32 synthase/23S rRNA pseudouridine746 synthase/23S rRNA pseudouridine1911/1915/1917 synthase
VRKHAVPGAKRLARGPAIIYEDRDILVVDKPAGLLTIATGSERERTAYCMLTDYVRKGCVKSRNRVFIVHRLDRETSGILVFAKTEAAKIHLQSNWDQTEKQYLAIVHGRVEKDADTIASYLTENRAHVVYATSDPTQGKLSRTAYRVLRRTAKLTLLEVTLLTGRKHQIRVHLSGLGHPIVGDRKYGRERDAGTKMALHARSIAFAHPFDGRRMSFEAAAPDFFRKLMGEAGPSSGGQGRGE